MDKRMLSKQLVRMMVALNAGGFVSKQLAARYPQTQKLHANEAAGMIAGAVAANKAQPYTDALVDEFFDRREAKKNVTS